MAIEQHFYLDTPASRQLVRDALVNAKVGLRADPDFMNISGASSEATHVVIRDHLGDPSPRHNNGIVARCRAMFRDTRAYIEHPEIGDQYYTETVLGVMGLLKAFPQADAYWTALDAEIPMLLRRRGCLVLAQGTDMWREEDLRLVDLPYVMEPLGPW